MIIGSSGFLGAYIHKSLKNRCIALKELLSAIDVLQAEIVFKRSELSEALKAVSLRVKGISNSLWSGMRDGLENDMLFEESFNAQKEGFKKLGLTKEDVNVFRNITGVLGKYDSLEQAQMLKNIKALLENQWTESERELKEKGKLYRALSISFGIVVALIAV